MLRTVRMPDGWTDIHFGGDTRKHVYHKGRLLGALKEANLAQPDFTGGLSRVVKE